MADDSRFDFIGRNIRTLRKQRKWTQEQLGARLRRRKLSRQAISWIESGRNTDLETIADIAGTLGVGVGEVTQDQAIASAPASPRTFDPQALVGDLLRLPEESWLAVVSNDARYSRPDVIRALLTEADSQFDVSLIRTRAINRTAAYLVRTVNVPPELRVEALKDLVTVVARMGDHDEALRVLKEAGTAARACAEPAYQAAIVDFTRAVAYVYIERTPEILQLLPAIRERFASRDRRRYLLTIHLEALVLAELGQPQKALDIIGEVVDDFTAWGDEDELARLYTVVSFAWMRLGDRDKAFEYLDRSRAIYEKKRRVAEIAGDDGRRAQLHAEFGEFDKAFALFGKARNHYVTLQMKPHVVGIDMSLLRAKIAAGADHREVHELCCRLATEAAAANMPMTACEAIDWLRRISERLTPRVVEHIESFVQSAERNPDLRFQPPDA